MLKTFLVLKLEELREDKNLGDIWCKREWETAHTAEIAMTFVSQRGDVEWPPRSPDLSMCDFSCGGI